MAPKNLDIFKDGHEALTENSFVHSLTQTKQRTVWPSPPSSLPVTNNATCRVPTFNQLHNILLH
jgi:hypothetical protein